ncbi:MAG: hypothetical protein AB8F26_05220 [Phycisphaerales bacterium]
MQKGTQTAAWLGDRSGSFDLRRTRDDRTSDRIVARACWLEDPDRSLILAVFRDGQPVTALARIQSEDPRALRRRVARAAARLLDARAEFVAEHAKGWAPARQRVAREIFHRGSSLRQTMRRTGLSLYTVRVHRDAIEGMFETEQSRDTPRLSVDRSWR